MSLDSSNCFGRDPFPYLRELSQRTAIKINDFFYEAKIEITKNVDDIFWPLVIKLICDGLHIEHLWRASFKASNLISSIIWSSIARMVGWCLLSQVRPTPDNGLHFKNFLQPQPPRSLMVDPLNHHKINGTTGTTLIN